MAEESRPKGEMPFLDHLEELRWRIIWSLVAVLVGFVIGFFVVTKFDVVGILKAPVAPFLAITNRRLMFTSPTEPIMLTLKLAFGVGVLLAFPVVAYQLWAFLSPALYSRERRFVLPAACVAVVLFLAGAVMAYVAVLPMALKVLFGFQSESLSPLITADAYFGFATTVVLAFGLIFELPLVLSVLVYLRILSAQTLVRFRRVAIVLNAILSAFLTPGPDVVSQILMMIPVQLFYELSIVFAKVLERRRARRERTAEDAAAAEA
jgi:sec-independent protein translocase protein TatC